MHNPPQVGDSPLSVSPSAEASWTRTGDTDPQAVGSETERIRAQIAEERAFATQVGEFLRANHRWLTWLAKPWADDVMAAVDERSAPGEIIKAAILNRGVPKSLRVEVARIYYGRKVLDDAPVMRRQPRLRSHTSLSHYTACTYCGKAGAVAMDHVWPRARGGTDAVFNLVPVCQPCNNRKGSSSWLTEVCPGCSETRDPGDVDSADGRAWYSCRCGTTWMTRWAFQPKADGKRVRPR